jgi:hypothetical protein
VAPQEKAILMLKKSRKNFPTGPRTPKIYNRKKPATVGGRTRGRVRRPSRIIFHAFRRTPATHLAARSPRKKVTTIAAVAVLMEIRMGDRFMELLINEEIYHELHKISSWFP